MSELYYIVTQKQASKQIETYFGDVPGKYRLQVLEIDNFLAHIAPLNPFKKNVIPLLLTCGKAYETLQPFTLKKPLIYNLSSAQKWAHFLVHQEPTLWVGHGDHQGITKFYYQMFEQQMQLIHPQQFIFLLSDDFSCLAPLVKRCGRKVILRSLFLTNGHHAQVDVSQNIKNEIEKMNIEVRCDTTPLLAYPEVVNYFLTMGEV